MEGVPRPDARSGRGARTRDAFVRHLGTAQVARVIYGAIIGMALVVALQAHPPSATEMTVALLSTAVAVGLAEGYSDVVGRETRLRRRLTREELREILDDVLAVMFGIVFPDIFFGLAADRPDRPRHSVRSGEVDRARADRVLRLLRRAPGGREPRRGVRARCRGRGDRGVPHHHQGARALRFVPARPPTSPVSHDDTSAVRY